MGSSQERIERELHDDGYLYRETAAGNPTIGRMFPDSDQRWVPHDLRVMTLGEYAFELGREVAALEKEAGQTFRDLTGGGFSRGQTRALYAPRAHVLWRRSKAIQTAVRRFGANEDTKVMAYSIDPEEWGKAEPFRTAGTVFLSSFCELGRDPELIFPFAQRFGGLRLCEHGLPPGHWVASGLPVCTPIGMEPFSAWQRYARVTEAVLVTVPRLYRGELAYREDWEVLAGGLNIDLLGLNGTRVPLRHVERLDGRLAEKLERQKRMVLKIVTTWLRGGEVATEILWLDRGVVEDETGVGLFGKIARELYYVVSKKDGKVICEHCRDEFIPSRVNPPGVPYFCEKLDCRRESHRVSERGRNERKKASNAFEDLVGFAEEHRPRNWPGC